ncbi:MAG: hypothetical protein JEY79_10170 [Pseudodesulfovibrio sp.]|nr:hypothetical protein [Pseudodesulfovibrio sp.]
MINKLACLAASFLFLLVCVMETFACDLYLPCERVEGIVVSEGREHLSGGKKKTVFVACVDVDATKINLKELVARCNHDSIVVKTGNTSITVPQSEFPGGD